MDDSDSSKATDDITEVIFCMAIMMYRSMAEWLDCFMWLRCVGDVGGRKNGEQKMPLVHGSTNCKHKMDIPYKQPKLAGSVSTI